MTFSTIMTKYIKQCHQIICGYEICIRSGTYQQYLNNWHKLQLKFLNDHAQLFMSVSKEQLNSESIDYRYSELLLPDG